MWHEQMFPPRMRVESLEHGDDYSPEEVVHLSDSSIHPSRILIVAKKELVDFIRDWRTVLAMILVPLMIFPAIFIALPLFLQGEAAELSAVYRLLKFD